MIDRMLVGLLTGGHILIEGVPGLAKTLAVRTLSAVIDASFQRIQFTPDLLPADLIGTMIYSPQKGEFSVKKGPIFANFILADEINRAPAKVQSALLEAMQEKQVTIGEKTFPLEEPFLVMATQNPIEQEGTYPLPEAQLDRFIFKLSVGYPNRKEELEILNRETVGTNHKVNAVIKPKDILAAREIVHKIYVDEKVKDYILNIVFATREPKAYKVPVEGLIAYGASPRATIFLTLAAKAHAFMAGRGYVTPEDVKAIGLDVLRHRVLLTFEAEAEEMSSDAVVRKVFDQIEVP
jgi:MoxR-like ATPase